MDWTSQKTPLPSGAGATAPLSCYMYLEEHFAFSYGINFLSYSAASVHADLSLGNSILNYLSGKCSSLKTHVARKRVTQILPQEKHNYNDLGLIAL